MKQKNKSAFYACLTCAVIGTALAAESLVRQNNTSARREASLPRPSGTAYVIDEADNDIIKPEQIRCVTIYNIPLSEELQKYTYSLCERYDIVEHYETVLGIMRAESSFNADAVSDTDDYGIMQINSYNHEWLKEELDIVDIMDVKSNIHCGVYIFADLMHRYQHTTKALMAYNMGPTGASYSWTEGIYSSAYSDNVLGCAELIKAGKKKYVYNIIR